MKNDLLPMERLKLAPDFEWPTKYRRVPPQKRRNVGCGFMDEALAEVVGWLDLADIGFAELSVAKGDDPGAVLRFEWRGKRLVTASDAFTSQAANVHSLRAAINVLTSLATDGHSEMLTTLLVRLADPSDRSLPMVEVTSEEALDSASVELDFLSDALLEAAVRIARGERSGALKTSVCETLVVWSTAGKMLRIRIETPPARPQGLALAQVGLEFEPWTASVEVTPTLESNRWILRISAKDLESPAAKEWLSHHTASRDRRPELIDWLREDFR